MLEKDHRIVIANGSLDKPLGVIGRRRANDFQTRVMHEPHLWVLGMKWSTMNVATAGPAQNQWRRRAPQIVRLGHHVADLVKSAADEIHELEFGHRAHAGERGSEGRADYGGLRNRRVDYAFWPKPVNKTFGDLERAAINTDIFAETKNGWVALHLLPDALANRFEIGKLGHSATENRGRCKS